MIKYADDVVTLIPITAESNVQIMLNSELDHVNSWCASNGLVLNKEKTKAMFILNQVYMYLKTSLDITLLTPQLRILGFTYESHMKRNTEMNTRRKKASQRRYILRQLKTVMQKTELTQIYSNLVLGVLEYCSPILNTAILSLVYLYKRFMRA